MILDLPRFVQSERPYWEELRKLLDRIGTGDEALSLEEAGRLHYLYERAAASLARLDSFSEPETRLFLESLVARAYSEIHESRSGRVRFAWKEWMLAFPRAFRRRIAGFVLAALITVGGCAFGAFAISMDPSSRTVIMPFPHLLIPPEKRVAMEEESGGAASGGQQAAFSSELMTHNIRVTLFTMGAGLTWGVGSVLLLFYNGVVLGAVAADYIQAGQIRFLLGWLLPHGAVEIPAILLGGQAGFLLASALIGWGERRPRSDRLRAIGPDLVAICGGAAALLVWAGIVEAFISQYHEPVLPYAAKIAFGVLECGALGIYLLLAGRK